MNEGVIILAALVGLFCLNKYKNTNVRYFIYFLVYVVFVEILGYYPRLLAEYKSLDGLRVLVAGTLFEKNYLWYAIFWQIGSALFLSFYFTINSIDRIYQKIIKYATIIYIFLTTISFIFNYEVYYNDHVKSIWFFGVFQITLCVVCYLLEILNSDRIMVFYKSINFYIAAMFLVWFLIKTPLIFYQIYYSSADWDYVIFRRDIILFANVLMYLTFVFALIYCKPDEQI